MTIAQQIEEIGIQKGIQQGKAEGRQEGKLEAQLEIAKQMLITGMDRQSVIKFTGLTDAEMINMFKDKDDGTQEINPQSPKKGFTGRAYPKVTQFTVKGLGECCI
ncbi:Rpn family recombination-promoting nuclease/putative transposase [Candidatus Arsenophonus triatominarum]|uniref:Rpn family recombination-promoting nuclease/putative transposase n=1 Tax=Candidatus Arsenophonus triatominarum TaxID=57911 RepID=UPI000A9B28A8|nr:Rpn family recombination-promoting nuclease/putative transposase [Candidatus Arsenophonus triatominarum]